MKFVSFIYNRKEYLGFLCEGQAFSLRSVNGKLPATMDAFLRDWDHHLPLAREAEQHIRNYPALRSTGFWPDQVEWLAPVPRPCSVRDGYSFRRHVDALEKMAGQPPVDFDSHPVFTFGNHHSVFGPGPIFCMQDHFENLDFELQIAAVICKKGRNIRAAQADEYIGGLMIMNGFSARRLQQEEMAFHLGCPKGKDFATSFGPLLATTDELRSLEVPCKKHHVGRAWNLPLACLLNGQVICRSNLADMEWTFAEIIERASYGADLHPGDIIGSGAVDAGCFVEINESGRSAPGFREQWLRAGDKIVLRADSLGELENTLRQDQDIFSILVQPKTICPK